MNKKVLLLINWFIIAVTYLSAQSASDVLEKGIVVKNNKKIVLSIESNLLNYNLNYCLPSDNPLQLPDSSIFLVKGEGIRIYIKPLNPLNYSVDDSSQIVLDPIDEAAAKALGSIIDLLDKVNPQSSPSSQITADRFKSTLRNLMVPQQYNELLASDTEGNICKHSESIIQKDIKDINDFLSQDKKADIVQCFNELKSLSFISEKNTEDSLADINKKILQIVKHFNQIDSIIKSVQSILKTYSDNCKDNTTQTFVYSTMLKQESDIESAQKKRLIDIQKVYKLVNAVCINASQTKEAMTWCVFLKQVSAKRGKLGILTININKAGYILSSDSEIISVNKTLKLKQVIFIRKFEQFVPEVSAGVAYADLTFPKYGVTTDSVTKKQYVASAGEESFKKVTVSAMINLVYFIKDSPINPFFQFGAGVNIAFPTLFVGGGFRLNFISKRIALSGGIASTWIQTLNKLKIGEQVSGTADLTNDLTYQFNWPPKPYFGIQYNF